MIKNVIYCIFLFSTHIFLDAMQNSIPAANFSVATSDEDLQNYLRLSQDEKDIIIKMTQSNTYNLIENAQQQIRTNLNFLLTISPKIEQSIEKIQTSAASDSTLNLIADLVIHVKTIGQTLITHLSNHLTELYIPIATSSIISDATIKQNMKTTLESIDVLMSQLKKTFPITIIRPTVQEKRSQPATLQQQTPVQTKSVPITHPQPLKQSGVEGLYQLITSRGAQGMPKEEKEKIITQVKQNYQEIQEYNDTINKAASATLTQLNSLKNMNKESADTMKKIFTIQQDPDYETAPLIIKYDTLSRGYNAMIETIKMLNENINNADAGIIKFIDQLLAAASTNANFIELKNLATQQDTLMQKINVLLDNGKNAIESSKKLFI